MRYKCIPLVLSKHYKMNLLNYIPDTCVPQVNPIYVSQEMLPCHDSRNQFVRRADAASVDVTRKSDASKLATSRRDSSLTSKPDSPKLMNRDKIKESWDRFATSLRDVAEAEWSQRKSELYKYVSRLPPTIYVHDYPLRSVLISTIPALYFMTFFQFYSFWQYLFHHERAPFTHLPTIERALFGCLPHQVVSRWTHPMLDFAAAFPYLAHFLLPFGYPVYCFWHRAKLGNTIEPALRALWLGGLVASLAVTFHFLFPTSPPWFNESAIYGPEGQLMSAAHNEAGFQRIDAIIRLPLFREIYANAPVTHGSFPSLHAAFPAIIFFNGSWVAHGGWKFGLCHLILISWAALYSHHHYLLDIIGGILLSFLLFQFYSRVWNPFTKRPSKPTTDSNIIEHTV